MATCLTSPKDEVKSFGFWRAIACEIFGTSILVGMAQMVSTNASTDGSPNLRAGLCIGITLMCIIEMIGHISGAHVNPIITTAFLIQGDISVFRACVYYPMQLLGAAIGASFAYGISSDTNRMKIGGPSVNPDITPVQAMFVEVFISAFLVMATLGATDAKHRPVFMPSITVGLTVATSIMGTANLSGGCMNPAAAFGPSLITGKWENHWVYWIGPISASVVGTIIYKFIFTFKAEDRNQTAVVDEELLKKLVRTLENTGDRNDEYVRILQNDVNADSVRESIL